MMRRCNTCTAVAITLVAAAVSFPRTARAGSVLLWACHGPGGEAVGAAPFISNAAGEGSATADGLGCQGPSGTGGLLATFSAPDPAGGSSASWRLPAPAGVTLDSLLIARTTSGFGGAPQAGDPQSYSAWTSSTTLESASLEAGSQPLGGELSIDPAAGEYVSLGVGCSLPSGERCASSATGTVGVEVSSIVLGVLDSSPPAGTISGVQSPVVGGTALHLRLDASDSGLGLADAEVSLDGQTETVVRLGGSSCPEHPAANATINLAYGAECPRSVSGVPLSVNTGPVGAHRLRVSVTDAAGNTTTLLEETIDVEGHPAAPGSDTLTLGVGSGSSSEAHQQHAATAKGEVLSYSSSGCREPMLSMRLLSKPLRYAGHHVPVLREGHRYRFGGSLTCMRSGRRVVAANGTALRVIYRVAWHRFESRRLTVRDGRLRMWLRPTLRTRSFLFRYRPHGGESVELRLPVKVAGRSPRLGRRAR